MMHKKIINLVLLAAVVLFACTKWSSAEEVTEQKDIAAQVQEPFSDEIYDLILLPTEDFPFQLAAQLANVVAMDTGLKVRSMLNLGIKDWQPYQDVPQYDPAKLKDLALSAIAQLRKNYGGALYVVLTTRDINSADRNLHFVYAEHYPVEKISVISVARMVFDKSGQQASVPIITDRLRKMILRTLGLQIYGLERSANPKDIMYSPLMSLDALDGMEAKWVIPLTFLSAGLPPWTLGMSKSDVFNLSDFGPYKLFKNGDLETYNGLYEGHKTNVQFFFADNKLRRIGIYLYEGQDLNQAKAAWRISYDSLKNKYGEVQLPAIEITKQSDPADLDALAVAVAGNVDLYGTTMMAPLRQPPNMRITSRFSRLDIQGTRFYYVMIFLDGHP